MNNAWYYQLFASISMRRKVSDLPRFLAEVLKKGEIDDAGNLVSKFKEEISGAPLTEPQKYGDFFFTAEQALLFCVYRKDYGAFTEMYELIENKLKAAKGQASEDKESWISYLSLISISASRLRRTASIEKFEEAVEEIDWAACSKDLISRFSGMIGWVFYNEDAEQLKNKSRFWLQKAVSETDVVSGLLYYLNLTSYYLSERRNDSQTWVQKLLGELESLIEKDTDNFRLYEALLFEFRTLAQLHKHQNFDDTNVRNDYMLECLKQLANDLKKDEFAQKLPWFAKYYLNFKVAEYYNESANSCVPETEKSEFLAQANESIKNAIRIAEKVNDLALAYAAKLFRISMASGLKVKFTEKDLKEVSIWFRKADDYARFAEASCFHANYNFNLNAPAKGFEILQDLIKNGRKNLHTGGIEMVIAGMHCLNAEFTRALSNPGITWVVGELESYFKGIARVVKSLDEHRVAVGVQAFRNFQEEYTAFAEASHLNLKVYLRYQVTAIRVLRLAAMYCNDPSTLKMVDKVLEELENENNPLHFAHAKWDEFKDVPNGVRNKVLNKCITITKGDLPAAAEHIDFSYRNLRSYITFNEVNRLGFFLDEQKTRNRQLENGIRLMFHDLYKSGTIFEVVFDMPKFLVDFADNGFSSQDMEEALSIKGTTAKKYIKIMMEIDMIELEKSVGRKHYYRLRKDMVMNRLGQEKEVIAG